jgi:hypothetical protein
MSNSPLDIGRQASRSKPAANCDSAETHFEHARGEYSCLNRQAGPKPRTPLGPTFNAPLAPAYLRQRDIASSRVRLDNVANHELEMGSERIVYNDAVEIGDSSRSSQSMRHVQFAAS